MAKPNAQSSAPLPRGLTLPVVAGAEEVQTFLHILTAGLDTYDTQKKPPAYSIFITGYRIGLVSGDKTTPMELFLDTNGTAYLRFPAIGSGCWMLRKDAGEMQLAYEKTEKGAAILITTRTVQYAWNASGRIYNYFTLTEVNDAFAALFEKYTEEE